MSRTRVGRVPKTYVSVVPTVALALACSSPEAKREADESAKLEAVAADSGVQRAEPGAERGGSESPSPADSPPADTASDGSGGIPVESGADAKAGDAVEDAGAKSDDDPPEPEDAEGLWIESGEAHDLDGDGKPEVISWTCADRSVIKVGTSELVHEAQYSDLIGCSAALVDLDPKTAGLQLMFLGDEHDEVGPDEHLFASYRNGALEEIWSGAADITVMADGSWQGETGDCNEFTLLYTTTVETMRWEGGKVVTTVKKGSYPIGPDDCAEP